MKIITEKNKIILVKRFQSLVWRLGAVVGVAGIDFIATNLNLFDIPLWLVAILSLVLAEITKLLNTK